MTDFTLPPSYHAYCKDRAVQSAVDHILNHRKKLEVPPDLEWDSLPDFHAAVLSAHQVRCDFATALHGLWMGVWQNALDDCRSTESLEPLSIQEQQEHSAYPCDTYSLWDSGFLERVYEACEHRIGLGVLIDTEQAWLAMWLLDGPGNDLTGTLALGDDWVSEPDDEGYMVSRDDLARFASNGRCISLDSLRRAAQRALQEIGRRLGCQ